MELHRNFQWKEEGPLLCFLTMEMNERGYKTKGPVILHFRYFNYFACNMHRTAIPLTSTINNSKSEVIFRSK